MKSFFDKIKIFFNRATDNGITYNELKNIISKNRDIYIIDVRSSQEFKEGYLQNAINIPLYDLKKKITQTVKNRSEIIILYCQSDIRSRKAKNILEKMGYNNIFYLRGGIDAIM